MHTQFGESLNHSYISHTYMYTYVHTHKYTCFCETIAGTETYIHAHTYMHACRSCSKAREDITFQL